MTFDEDVSCETFSCGADHVSDLDLHAVVRLGKRLLGALANLA
jgi:hypothetical protein